jgi:hypothetical protein
MIILDCWMSIDSDPIFRPARCASERRQAAVNPAAVRISARVNVYSARFVSDFAIAA